MKGISRVRSRVLTVLAILAASLLTSPSAQGAVRPERLGHISVGVSPGAANPDGLTKSTLSSGQRNMPVTSRRKNATWHPTPADMNRPADEFERLRRAALTDGCASLTSARASGRCTRVETPAIKADTSRTISGARARIVSPDASRSPRREPDCNALPFRMNSCRNVGWGYTVWEVINGVPVKEIGGAQFEYATGVAWDYLSVNWSLRGAISVTALWGTELVLPGPDAVVSTGCTKIPAPCQSDGTSYYFRLTLGEPVHTQAWEQYETAGVGAGTRDIVSMLGYIGPVMVVRSVGAPHETLQFDIAQYNGVDGQCDRLAYGSTVGCIAAEREGDFIYAAPDYPTVGLVAQHVYDAQRALPNNPGWPAKGIVLTWADDATRDANRRHACPNSPPGDDNSCDEFPIARAREGGSLGFPYSTREVPIESNSSQGGLTAKYTLICRMLTGDPFYILAILPDGRWSWDE
ncbi:deoxyribonuclease NucA/NucB [Herbihabitans rhizosphaerae]|uniref:Deoxyribonuclease NucA/NucB n=1 Tax=Herbihabitans rhizosphaerae TaxID=1872711 RepID=A0A4Q7KLH0_9PSEU|nr:deoxyribonuclease NucA/NucB [Herbihabitans rhizosphaerae]